MDWISVKDRLPSHGQAILALETFPEDITFQAIAKPLVNTRIQVTEYGSWGNGFVNKESELLRFVTHWMPLPEVPKRH